MNMEYIINLLSYFIIYSFLGWVLESVYKTILLKKPVNSGFLFGPFCAIYGFGALIMYLLLDSFKENYLLLFIMGVIFLSAWEYLVGFILEKLFKTKYWDYSNEKINLHGRICLRASICWGVLGLGFTLFLHPFVIGVLEKVPGDVLIYAVAIIMIYIIVDTIISIIKVKDINIGINKAIEIRETIAQKLDELKNLTANSKNVENIKNVIEDLREKENQLKEKITKQTKRFTSAFPTMKSEKISQILNYKIDIREILKNDKK